MTAQNTTHAQTAMQQQSESELNIYLVEFQGKQRLIEAADLRTLKQFILDEAKFAAKQATGPEVMNFYKQGGKVETATPAAE